MTPLEQVNYELRKLLTQARKAKEITLKNAYIRNEKNISEIKSFETFIKSKQSSIEKKEEESKALFPFIDILKECIEKNEKNKESYEKVPDDEYEDSKQGLYLSIRILEEDIQLIEKEIIFGNIAIETYKKKIEHTKELISINERSIKRETYDLEKNEKYKL